MPTCTVPMRIDTATMDKPLSAAAGKNRRLKPALVLVELIIVIIIMTMMVALASVSLIGVAGRSEFEKEAQSLINILKMAQNAAAESDQRYAVVFDFDEGTYTLRPFARLDMEQVLDEEPVMMTGYFTDRFQLDYVLYDDFTDTRDWDVEEMDYFRAWFWAGHSGWQYGGKIVLLDIDGYPYSIVINRLSKMITLETGDVEILEPIYKEYVPF